jgi:hypothetical protein
VSVRSQTRIHNDLGISLGIQYERWRFATISPAQQTDVTASFELTIWPAWGKK